uniref:Oxysterol-binding protein n=1 Tax=Eutreptiella gymnastica TaxID=73025 RepID=A0A7S1NF52_9EUGL
MPVPFFLDKTMLEMLHQNEMRRVDLLLHAGRRDTPVRRFLGVLEYIFSCCLLEEFGRKPLLSRPGETIASVYRSPDGGCAHFFAESLPLTSPTFANTLWTDDLRLYSCGNITIREKFYGTSIHGVPEGRRTVCLGEESYTMTPPSIAVRLLRGFSEYVGESVLECPETGLKACITFEAKPLLRGREHQVRGTVVDTTTDACLFTITGNWMDKVWVEAPGKSRELLHMFQADGCATEPVEESEEWDTRRVWAKVKAAIRRKDWAAAAAEKRAVEQTAPAAAPAHYTFDERRGLYIHNAVPGPRGGG